MIRPSQILFWIYFYMGWYGIVSLGQKQDSILSLLLPLPPLAYLLWQRELPFKGYLRAVVLCAAGLIFDSLSNYLGWISFIPAAPFPAIPLWLFSLWLLYFCYMPLLAKVFQNHWLWALAMGAVFGPLSYFTGTYFELLRFNATYTIFIYALFWGTHLMITARILWK